MSREFTSKLDRRRFLGVSAGTGMLLLKPTTVFGSEANSSVELGLIGCGSRGNWIAPFFRDQAAARIVAVADVIRENLDKTRDKLGIDSSQAYYGPDAYGELANAKLDGVIIETPTYYHPEHALAAVEAGKHVYLAKPVAVDVPGCRTILEAGRKAGGKVSFWVDFQTRARPVFQEAAQRVHRGDIGKTVFGQVFYYTGRAIPDRSRPGMDPGLARILNFYVDRVLGGDIIVEQNIHVIDVANWFLESHPVRAFGTGGRTDWTGTQYNTGDAWDHFLVSYWYPNDVQVNFSSNQLTRSFQDLCVRCFGIRGMIDAHYNGLVRINGENPWMGTEKDATFDQGAIQNVKDFVASIQSGKLLNNAESAVESNLTAILGRTAAYHGAMVTWDEMMRSTEKWEAHLKLQW